jgi:hypothetical protein
MSIDPEKEHCYPLAKAAKMLPTVRGKKPPHPMTLYRWATTGLKARSGKRVWLETTFVGGTLVTSREALFRFFERKNDVRYEGISSSELESRLLEQRADQAKKLLRDMAMLR